ncbi:MAG TPA: twin-arginine translocase TatA/TatE family subunit [Anaerolineaceae bacterium]|nr:twin-arginine translocase TatA/TatE family subunit [Anaerolineaceae bacterium]
MEFFNIGGLELLLILLIALLALGPKRIVEVGHKLGNAMRKLSKNLLFQEIVQTTDEIRNYPRKIMDEAKLDMSDLDMTLKIRDENDVLDKSLNGKSTFSQEDDFSNAKQNLLSEQQAKTEFFTNNNDEGPESL